MLYKPSNPTPYNAVVDSESEVTFSASCVSTSDVTDLRLAIKSDVCEYYLPLKNTALSNCIKPSNIEMPLNTTNFNGDEGYYIQSNNYDRQTGLAIPDILQPLIQYIKSASSYQYVYW